MPASKEFKLPRYLRLAKGSMWFDTEGDSSSGVKLFSMKTVMVGRGKDETSVAKDKFDNKNFLSYGFADAPSDLPWYFDTTKVPKEKLSRIIIAYKNKILVKADPNNPPSAVEIKTDQVRDFKIRKEDGERIFVGKNKAMYYKLQSLTFVQLRDFVQSCPKTGEARDNLIDMYHYERAGYNKLARPRLEVLDLIRGKLNEYGPSLSSFRINEDTDKA